MLEIALLHKFYTTAGRDGRDKSQLWTYSQCANYTHYQRNSITTPNLHPSVGRAEEKKTSFTLFVLKILIMINMYDFFISLFLDQRSDFY